MTTWLQIVEVGLKHSKTLVSIFVFIVSLTGYTVYDFVETTKAKSVKDVREVATGFQQLMVEQETKVKVEMDCNSCRGLWLNDIEKNKKEMENKYHR